MKTKLTLTLSLIGMSKLVAFASIGIILTVPTLRGSVTINSAMSNFFMADGVTSIPSTSVGVLVVDKTGDGFASSLDILDSILDVGNNLGIVSNEILRVVAAEDLGFGGLGFNLAPTNFDLVGGISQGDSLGFYWFTNLSPGDTVTAGTSYGFFRSDSVLSGSGADFAWSVPADGSIIELSAYLDSITGSSDGISNSTFSASLTVVPEPATYAAIFGVLALALVAYRRRRA